MKVLMLVLLASSTLMPVTAQAINPQPSARPAANPGVAGVPTPSPTQTEGQRNQTSPEELKRQLELQKNLNKQRNEEIKKDTDKLLDLANELKKSVDAAGTNTLSLEVIRKTDEIEKLAKKVRGKMKETYEMPGLRPDVTSR